MAILKQRDFRKLAIDAARVASDKKALDIILLDLRKASDIADYMVIITAESTTQMRAIDDSIDDAMAMHGLRPTHRDDGNRWLALDYGGFMVHLFLPDAREFYRLEHLWEDPQEVAWEERAAPKKSTARRRAPKQKTPNRKKRR